MDEYGFGTTYQRQIKNVVLNDILLLYDKLSVFRFMDKASASHTTKHVVLTLLAFRWHFEFLLQHFSGFLSSYNIASDCDGQPLLLQLCLYLESPKVWFQFCSSLILDWCPHSLKQQTVSHYLFADDMQLQQPCKTIYSPSSGNLTSRQKRYQNGQALVFPGSTNLDFILF